MLAVFQVFLYFRRSVSHKKRTKLWQLLLKGYHRIKEAGTKNIRIAVHHNGGKQHIGTNFYVHKSEITKAGTIKNNIVLESIQREKSVLRDICNVLGSRLNEMSFAQLKSLLEAEIKGKNVVEKPIDIIEHLMTDYHRLLGLAKKKGKYRSTTASYRKTVANSLKTFTKSETLDVNKITLNFAMSYIDWLKGNKIKFPHKCKKNAEIINKALNELKYIHNDEDNGVIKITVNPFEKIKQGRQIGAIDHKFEKHTKRPALDVAMIQKMIDLKTFDSKQEEFARDMFLLSFSLVGMNSADLFSCRNYVDGILTYNRQKVEDRRADNGLIKIRIEPEIFPLFEKYKNLNHTKNEVFNFCNKHRNSECFNIQINAGLKLLKTKIGLSNVNNFTQYSARRSWTTVSRNDAKVGKYDVHEALNHVDADMKVTDLYVDKNFSHIWDANRKVLDLFDWSNIR